MDSAAYEREISSRFLVLDQDRNGAIDREDFHRAAAALLAEFGVTARSEKGQELYGGAEAFWQGLAGIADVDGDQRVTRQEFVTGAVKRLRDSPARFAEIARPFLHAAVAVMDRDGAGPTTPSVTRALRVLGVPDDDAASAVARLDADGDGRIGEDELLAALAVYVVTPEP